MARDIVCVVYLLFRLGNYKEPCKWCQSFLFFVWKGPCRGYCFVTPRNSQNNLHAKCFLIIEENLSFECETNQRNKPIHVGQEHNFNRYKPKQMDSQGGAYDFSSIMHYGNYAFSKNNKPTMLSVKDPMLQFGQIEKLSDTDILQLNSIYDCKCEYNVNLFCDLQCGNVVFGPLALGFSIPHPATVFGSIPPFSSTRSIFLGTVW